MTRVAIALGSNLGDPIANVQSAIAHLKFIASNVRASSLYKTKPWGFEDQPYFINAAATLDWSGTAEELLKATQEIERKLGRTPTFKWGPRLIDIDILTFGDATVDSPDLRIPHPHMLERAFVLVPLAEIAPQYQSPLEELPIADRNGVCILAVK